MKKKNIKLTKNDDWSDKWKDHKLTKLDKIIVKNNPFEDVHKVLKKHLPKKTKTECIEIGCYPGRFMRYFHEEFGYVVSGLEYVKWCETHATELLNNTGIEATVYHGDIIKWRPKRQWDVVCSFGLIEHFKDVNEIVEKHMSLVKPDGWLVFEYPNHAGLYGIVMKMVNRESYNMHNQMSLKYALDIVNKNTKFEVIEGSYRGKVSFSNSGLYPWLRKKGKVWYYSIGGVAVFLEKVGKYLPNTKFLSPYSLIVAKKNTTDSSNNDF